MEGLPKNVDLLKGLDLFSGIGGIGTALSPWVRTVAYCEFDRYAQGVLLSRMRLGDIDRAPIWDDVRTLHGDLLPRIDIIFGGFPCQDISTAGPGGGLDGERSGLFFEIMRLVGELRPRFIFLENVPAITLRGLDRILLGITALGYDCRWTIVSAAEVGAPHLRERWFLLAHSNGKCRGLQPVSESRCENSSIAGNDGQAKSVADSNGGGELQPQGSEQEQRGRIGNGGGEPRGAMAFTGGQRLEEPGRQCGVAHSSRPTGPAFAPSWWATEPNVGRVANGVPARMDRIKCLGNSVVPSAAREAFTRLLGIGG